MSVLCMSVHGTTFCEEDLTDSLKGTVRLTIDEGLMCCLLLVKSDLQNKNCLIYLTIKI